MEHDNIINTNQFMCREHKTRYPNISLDKDTSKKLLCAKCLDGHIYGNLMDIEDVLSLKTIAEYENKYLKQNKESANDIQKICKEVFAELT